MKNTKHQLSVIDLTNYIFTSPEGVDFIYRFSLEEFVPTPMVAQLNRYLDRAEALITLPIAEHEPMYVAYTVETVVQFFTQHIGTDSTCVKFPLRVQHSTESQVADVSGTSSVGDLAAGLRAEEMSRVPVDGV